MASPVRCHLAIQLSLKRCCRYVLCTFDCTVFPANSLYVKSCQTVAASALAMGSTTLCHVQMPVVQSQTSPSAVLTHRRLLEDQFFKANLNINNHVQLLFKKEDCSTQDKRALSQLCLALTHNNFPANEWVANSTAVKSGVLGPVSLLRCSDFLGYDEASRPGASARVEQKLGIVCESG